VPRVSVLMPTHNRADVVCCAVASVLDQTLDDFELLVAADGCTDGTIAVIRSFDDERIRLFDLPKAPFYGYANRNIVLRQARGDVVAFAAHDDLLLPDHLERTIAALERTGAEWVYSRPLWVSTDGFIVPFCTNLEHADEMQFFLTIANTIPASCVVHRRECLERCGYWPEDVPWAADWELWKRILNQGRSPRFSYLSDPTTLHFSAVWKASRHSASEEVRTLLQIAETADWWPKALRYQIPDGTPEQRVIARAMTAGGAAWCHELRGAVRGAIDRLAWDLVRSVRPQLHAREQEAAALRSDLAAHAAALAMARESSRLAAEELQQLVTSRSWRLTAPLRAARRFLGH
jgi:GT2 family glycosyltransferase